MVEFEVCNYIQLQLKLLKFSMIGVTIVLG